MTAGDRVVFLYDREAQSSGVYPAVVVWRLERGVAWVQPGYLDPLGAAANQFHRINGPVIEAGESLVVSGDRLEAMISRPDEPPEDVRRALDWYAEELIRRGLDRKAEAARLELVLFESLI